MKAVLNVQGSKLKVTAIYYRENGLPSTVYAVDEDGREQQFIEKSQSKYVTHPHVAVDSLADLLEYPALEAKIVDGNNQLIKHLEDMQKEEHNRLVEMAIEAMESESDLPFDSHLSIKQKEYKLMQQRVFGIIDTIEEIKAYLEGYYANGNDTEAKA